MRYRRGGPDTDKGGDAFTSLRSRSDPSSAAHAAHDPEDDRELVAEHQQNIQEEVAGLMRENDPMWNCRCSGSILLALTIWALIGLFVVTTVTRNDFTGTYSSMHERHVGGVGGAAGATAGPATALVSVHDALPDGCKGVNCQADGGSAAFGAILGAHNGVFGFSNCYSHSCISLIGNEIDVLLPAGSTLAVAQEAASRGGEDDDDAGAAGAEAAPVRADGRVLHRLSSGMKWQCVEYARRYWILQGTPQPALFGDVDSAADIWERLSTVTLLDGSTTPLFKHGNGVAVGQGGSRPRVGDLLLYQRDVETKDAPAEVPYGHVAVIVGVDEATGVVLIAEQNWSSQPWPGPHHNYSRQLELTVATDEDTARPAYSISDPFHPVAGWVRYARYDD